MNRLPDPNHRGSCNESITNKLAPKPVPEPTPKPNPNRTLTLP